MQSELLPSACIVELPSNPQLGMSARVGGCSKDLIRVLPRNPGMGVLTSSQMYSRLFLVIVFLCVGASLFDALHGTPAFVKWIGLNPYPIVNQKRPLRQWLCQ